jgi:hypothetical protein
VTKFADSGLSPNTTYFYRVRAYNAGGNSVFSNETSGTTLPSAPSAPSGLTVAAMSSSKIELTWADSSNNEDGFKIQRKKGATGTYVQIATVGANVTQFANLGLSPNTTYFYRVRAYNAGGNSAYSNEANATTLSDTANIALKRPVLTSSTDFSMAIIPESIALAQNCPNPFGIGATCRLTGSPTTQIRYALPRLAQVTLIIYNALGQEVRRLVDGHQSAGYHIAEWNGRDQQGNPAPSGVYHYRLQADDVAVTKKMVLAN